MEKPGSMGIVTLRQTAPDLERQMSIAAIQRRLKISRRSAARLKKHAASSMQHGIYLRLLEQALSESRIILVRY